MAIQVVAGGNPNSVSVDLAPVSVGEGPVGSEVRVPGQALRYLAADEMWDRVEPYLRDFGITRLAHITHLDRLGVPVHMAMKPAGRTLSSGSGKGVSVVTSAVGAVMEAIEQTYWESCRPPLRMATTRELSRDGAAFVGVESLPMLRHQFVDDDLAIAWIALWDIAGSRHVWTPAEIVYVPFDDEPRRLGGVTSSTNGLASGSHVFEAILSALMEVVERDSVSVAGSPGRARKLSDEAASSPRTVALASQLEREGVALGLDDLTSDDIGVPTLRAVITDLDDLSVGRFVGYGSSLDLEVAAVRAITEAAQSRCIVVAGARDDIFEMQRRALRRFASTSVPVADSRSAAPARSTGTTGSIVGDIQVTVDLLRRAGFTSVLVHRYSAPGDPVQVVRVVVPGLEGHRFPNSQPGLRSRSTSPVGPS